MTDFTVYTNQELDHQVLEYDRRRSNGTSRPISLIAFDKIEESTEPEYVIDGILPAEGLAVCWGPPKSLKSFWVHDMAMHVALGWEYRGRQVRQGPVVYCAFEGGNGFKKRCVAFRQRFLESYEEPVPFYLEPLRLDLIKDADRLVDAIRTQLGGTHPILITLDTLNRSLVGSESRDEDMSAYLAAADKLREEFRCAVVIVHHCGVEAGRPRGHTSLTGAADAQLTVKRTGKNSTLTVEFMKDGEEGAVLCSGLEVIELPSGLTSCVLVHAEGEDATAAKAPRMSKNEQTMFSILHSAKRLSISEWNERAREQGMFYKNPYLVSSPVSFTGNPLNNGHGPRAVIAAARSWPSLAIAKDRKWLNTRNA
jgi:hypothetical protein